nr:MAG TPA: hypothetical protein [Bacteriophage sp.]
MLFIILYERATFFISIFLCLVLLDIFLDFYSEIIF